MMKPDTPAANETQVSSDCKGYLSLEQFACGLLGWLLLAILKPQWNIFLEDISTQTGVILRDLYYA